jgi:predicted AAA+ superfamily ATPase
MDRKQQLRIEKDLRKKMVFIVGPRQVGKTWLAKNIAGEGRGTAYLNYDRLEDRKIIKREAWLKSTELLILDEIHKMPGWKNFLKGVYDTRPEKLRILVTGSARLDLARHAGDSLAGRVFVHRLLPCSPSELAGTPLDGDIERLLARGGFPEPLLVEEAVDADRWRIQYIDDMIRSDVFDLERIYDLRAMRIVLELLRSKVGTPISYRALAQDAEIAPNTARKYVQILETLYVVFKVTPYSKSIARSLLKNPKLYFYDTGMVMGGAGAVFENFTAVCLFKHALAKTDAEGRDYGLHMIRTKEGKEVDFCIARDGKAELLVESKVADPDFDRTLAHFSRSLGIPGVQVVKDLKRERRSGDLELRMAETWFRELYL